ncbi:MAG: hypothetical protein LBV43_11360 [Prevotella sp.]|jgi:hypothetical protein|nr:hypothetical protein [Prevotella sp.]
MKNALTIIFSLLLISQVLFAQEETEKEPTLTFAELVEKNLMTFAMPEGYKEVETIKNPHMNYEYAIKHETEDFEIRYAIRSLEGLINDYEEREKNKKEGEENSHPNAMYPTIAFVVGSNISGIMPDKMKIAPFPDESVKNEFGADKGCNTTFDQVREQFANGYKNCTMVVIQKDDVATAYCFFMYNDVNTFMKLAMPTFYRLRFK